MYTVDSDLQYLYFIRNNKFIHVILCVGMILLVKYGIHHLPCIPGGVLQEQLFWGTLYTVLVCILIIISYL